MAAATVLRASGGVYDVELADGTVAAASIRGRLKLQQRTGDRVVAGDLVRVDSQPDGSLTIEAVEPRRSELVRRSPGHGRRAKVIVANIDRVVVVLAAAQPEPKRRLLDRFLVIAEANHLEAVIVLNKTDLVPAAMVGDFFASYEAIGYRAIGTSVYSGAGLDLLKERLCGARSVVTGPSGVGKSSLLNAIQPGLGLRVAAVSAAVQKGQHTTVTAELIPLQCGGYVADTPGLRELGLWGIAVEELPGCFPEFGELPDACRFTRSCSHTHEPGCAVRAAVDAGRIDSERFDSYRTLREETLQAPR
jgi:ribosome biogenesis GTPase / thiamine phosphate phosphatase